jgi:2-polyprenyl-6-methoxyphenol hydroxylase-like FAD-dependent oxidoreductase
MQRRRALVIGGSIGGLLAANLLRVTGWDVAVFEKSVEDLSGRGSGIGTRDELFRIMRRVGAVLDPSIGVPVRSRIFLDRTGKIVDELALPSLHSAWDRLYRLLKAVLPEACYHAGVSFARYETRDDGVTAWFADGTQREGDLLVGADGLYSKVRAALAPESEARYAGYAAWRGVLEERDMPDVSRAALAERFAFCLPPGELIIGLPMPGRGQGEVPGPRRYHWVWFRPVDLARGLPDLCTDETGHCHGTSIPPPLIRRDLILAMRRAAAELLAPQLAALVERTAQPFLQPIYDLATPVLARDRVALLGDAAFFARPHVGTGVTKAALDAECLADALTKAGADIPAGLAQYDRVRGAAGNELVARARRLGAYLDPTADPAEAAQQKRPETVLAEYGAAGGG